MRNLVRVLLATTVVMSMGLTALASGSVSTSYEVSGVTAADGSTVELVVSASSETIAATDAVAAITSVSFDADEVAVLVQDIDLVGVLADSAWPLTITLAVDAITADSDVAVLHYYDGAWNEETAVAGDGTVTISGIDSLSPFAIVYTSAEGTSSPTTGQASTTAVVMLAAVALGTAFVVSKRKVA